MTAYSAMAPNLASFPSTTGGAPEPSRSVRPAATGRRWTAGAAGSAPGWYAGSTPGSRHPDVAPPVPRFRVRPGAPSLTIRPRQVIVPPNVTNLFPVGGEDGISRNRFALLIV